MCESNSDFRPLFHAHPAFERELEGDVLPIRYLCRAADLVIKHGIDLSAGDNDKQGTLRATPAPAGEPATKSATASEPLAASEPPATSAQAAEPLKRPEPSGVPPLAAAKRVERWIRQICVVELNGSGKGTGFLIGRDLVLTCHHVISSKTAGQILTLRFDYNWGNEADGVQYGVADDWLIVHEPPTPYERNNTGRKLPRPREHDFAVLRLREPIGEKRGWIQLPIVAATPTVSVNVFILGHANGKRLQEDLGEVVYVKDRRFGHSVATAGGASGAPVFSHENQILMGLHHSGPQESGSIAGRAIPIGPIAEAIRKVLELELPPAGSNVSSKSEGQTAASSAPHTPHPGRPSGSAKETLGRALSSLSTDDLTDLFTALTNRVRDAGRESFSLRWDDYGGDKRPRIAKLIEYVENQAMFDDLMVVTKEKFPGVRGL